MSDRIPRMAKVGMWTAWTLATFLEFNIRGNPAASLLALLACAAIGFGLRAGKAWSGYGGALLVSGLAAFGLMRGAARGSGPWAATGVLAVAAVLLYLAGRSLTRRVCAES